MNLAERRVFSTRWVFSLLLALAVLVAAVYYGADLLEALRKVSIPWASAGLVCYAVNYGMRAARFGALSHGIVRIWPVGLHVACLHGFATYMLPFRSGEMTLPVLLRSMTSMPLGDGSRLLVQARFLDLQTLGAWIIAAALVVDLPLSSAIRAAWFVAGASMLMLPLFLRRLARGGRRSGYRPFVWLGQFVVDGPANWPALLYSACIWAAVAGCYYCAAHAIGLPLNLTQVWLLITIQLPMQLIPVQGIANTGNHEGGWVAGLLLLGIPTADAVEFALLSHAIIFLYVLALGPLGLLTGALCPSSTNH